MQDLDLPFSTKDLSHSLHLKFRSWCKLLAEDDDDALFCGGRGREDADKDWGFDVGVGMI